MQTSGPYVHEAPPLEYGLPKLQGLHHPFFPQAKDISETTRTIENWRRKR